MWSFASLRWTLCMDGVVHLAIKAKGTWVAQSIKCLSLAQVRTSGSRDRFPHQALYSVGCLLLPLPRCSPCLCSSVPPPLSSKINKVLENLKKRESKTQSPRSDLQGSTCLMTSCSKSSDTVAQLCPEGISNYSTTCFCSICCFLCLDHLSPYYVHEDLPQLLHVLAQISSLQWYIP